MFDAIPYIHQTKPGGDLDGKVVLIMGCSPGFGETVARLFANEGATIVVACRQKGSGREFVKEICQSGRRAIYIHVDASREEEIRRSVAMTYALLDRIDILINLAGEWNINLFPMNSIEDMERFIAVQTQAYFRCIQEVIPVMASSGNGVILNVCTLGKNSALYPFFIRLHIHTNLLQLSKAFANKYGINGIRTICLMPEITMTDLIEEGLQNPVLENVYAPGKMDSLQAQAEEALNLVLETGCDQNGVIVVSAREQR